MDPLCIRFFPFLTQIDHCLPSLFAHFLLLKDGKIYRLINECAHLKDYKAKTLNFHEVVETADETFLMDDSIRLDIICKRKRK